MLPISLEQVTTMAEGILIRGDRNLMISSVHFDTRQLDPGALFVPSQGERDGHDYIHIAQANGASAALVSNTAKIPASLPDHFGLILVNDPLRSLQKLAGHYRNSFTFPFIAVTGSVGKTTTKDIIAHLLSSKLTVYKTYKNLNNHIGVPFSLLQLNDSHQAAVLELGMRKAGEIDLLASLVKPQISVITYIGDSHLEYFGIREKIALAKAELLPHTDQNGLVLLNGDNSYLRQISHLFTGNVLFYSVTGPADLWAENLQPDEQGTHFEVKFADGDSFPAFLPLFGAHHVLNALPAIAIARHLGLTKEDIIDALATVGLSAMRFEVDHLPSGAILINDAYNASPASMEAAISTFAEIFPNRSKVLVLGDMYELGAESQEMHMQVGKWADQLKERFSLLIAIGDHARYLFDAFTGEKRYFATKAEAIPALQALNTKDHAFLLKASRGMELETLAKVLQE